MMGMMETPGKRSAWPATSAFTKSLLLFSDSIATFRFSFSNRCCSWTTNTGRLGIMGR